MVHDTFQTGRLKRFMSLGSLSGLVGASYLGHRLKSTIVSPDKAAEDLQQTNIRNAKRIARTFGNLKGAVMKVGQMMSLQAGLFPEEFTAELSTLQQDSPSIPFELIQNQIEHELGAPINKLFKSFDQTAFASASIGQVHRAVLPEGTEVAIKVQYPGVAAMVDSDMKNLRMLFRSIARYKLNMDVLIIWSEIRERLEEELNYDHELQNILDFRARFQDDPKILIPEPIPEYCTRQVLTLEYISGLSWRDLIAPSFPETTRNELALTLFRCLLRQLFDFRLLHADPNLANFNFRQDGRLILYDFGCVKHFSQTFMDNYKQLVIHAVRADYQELMNDLKKIGFSWTPETAIDEKLIKQFTQTILRPYLVDQPYDFGEATLHVELFDIISQYLPNEVKFTIPPDMVFLDRVIGGMYGNMMKLRARANWKKELCAALGLET
ncbi:AarF/ABC1/UbiB kinase family protein [bacterium]|nr:AarF/ABC1/UbiB kinase family protein [bacterium]